MSAVNLAKTAPDPVLYAPFETKAELMRYMRDQLIGVDGSRLADMLQRLSATHTGVWTDPEATN